MSPVCYSRLKRSDTRLWAEILVWMTYLKAIRDRTKLEEFTLMALSLVRAAHYRHWSAIPRLVIEFATTAMDHHVAP